MFRKILSLMAILLLTGMMLFAGGTSEATPEENDTVKAAFVYIGPAGDYGWTYAHEQGRLYVEEKFPWIETVTVESVPEGETARFIDRLVQEQKVDIVFTTSFGYMDGTVAAAEKYPDVTFFHCSGFKRAPNMGTYMGDMYQIYYLNGLIAGAMTETNTIGYVAAFPIPELFRHMNAFALGVKEVNPDAVIRTKWTYTWYGPDKAQEATEVLIAEGADFLAFTEDTPTVVSVAQTHMESGDRVYAFSHYSPMESYGELSAISGQLTDWGVIYEQILNDYRANPDRDWSDYDVLWFLEEGAVELGASWENKINPTSLEEVKATMVGDQSLYDLVMERYEAMKQGREVFDPFVGPIYDTTGELRVAEGEMASIPHLFAEMDYLIDNFAEDAPQ